MMENDSLMNFYVDYINKNVLPKINYDRLQADYETAEKAYAKSVLNALHQGVVAVYGIETFDRDTADGYVLLPGVVQSKEHGKPLYCTAGAGFAVLRGALCNRFPHSLRLHQPV